MFNPEKFDAECRSLVQQIHQLAVDLGVVASLAQEFIGGRLIAKEMNNAAMELYVMENHFRHDVFEIGEDSD